LVFEESVHKDCYFSFAVDIIVPAWLSLSRYASAYVTTIQHTMKPKDIFSLAVRLLGLVFLYHGLSALPSVLSLIPPSSVGSFVNGIIMFAWPLVVAYWLLGGAPLLMCIAYPDAED
jgi:hypothetical protein